MEAIFSVQDTEKQYLKTKRLQRYGWFLSPAKSEKTHQCIIKTRRIKENIQTDKCN